MSEELALAESDGVVTAPALPPLTARVIGYTPEQEMGFEVARLVPSAGTLELDDKQEAILFPDIPLDVIEIRPDGLIYAPWMEYATRLRKAFHGNWSLVPKGDPKMGPNGSSILWGFYLIIQGKLVSYAIGEQEYHSNNATMSWSDACEGAKSNALMRCCKGMGIGLELWSKPFVESWKAKYAETYWDNKKGKYLWRKKGSEVKEGPGQGVQTTGGASPSPAPVSSPAPSKFYLLAEIGAEKSRVGDDAYYTLLLSRGFKHANEVPVDRRANLLEKLRAI